jgi:hypothetical protein
MKALRVELEVVGLVQKQELERLELPIRAAEAVEAGITTQSPELPVEQAVQVLSLSNTQSLPQRL